MIKRGEVCRFANVITLIFVEKNVVDVTVVIVVEGFIETSAGYNNVFCRTNIVSITITVGMLMEVFIEISVSDYI